MTAPRSARASSTAHLYSRQDIHLIHLIHLILALYAIEYRGKLVKGPGSRLCHASPWPNKIFGWNFARQTNQKTGYMFPRRGRPSTQDGKSEKNHHILTEARVVHILKAMYLVTSKPPAHAAHMSTVLPSEVDAWGSAPRPTSQRQTWKNELFIEQQDSEFNHHRSYL